MDSLEPGQVGQKRPLRLILGLVVVAVLIVGFLLFVDGKRDGVPNTAESPGSSQPAVPSPQAPTNPAPGTTDNPK